MAFRSFFFFITFDLGNLGTNLVLWIPYNIQFATFSLILVFYAKLYYNTEWAQHRHTVWGVFGVANAFFFGLVLGTIAHSCVSTSCIPSDLDSDLFSRATGAAFLLLTVVYTYYGFWLVVSSRAHKISVPNIQGSGKIAVVTAMAWLIFVTRGVYDIVKTFRIGWELTLSTGGEKYVGPLVFFCFLFWEVAPTSIILIYFRHIPATRAIKEGLQEVCCCKTLFGANDRMYRYNDVDSYYTDYGHGDIIDPYSKSSDHDSGQRMFETFNNSEPGASDTRWETIEGGIDAKEREAYTATPPPRNKDSPAAENALNLAPPRLGSLWNERR
jgi:hypothetical protein